MNLTTFIHENFSALIATFSSLTGVFLGSFFTWISQKKSFDRQIEWEQKKKEFERQEELTNAYNSILKTHGEKEVIDYNQGRKHELQVRVYTEEIRPLLYEKFHLLHPEIASSVKSIDEKLLKWSVLEEAEEGEEEYVAGLYLSIIHNINKNIDLLRRQYKH